MRYIFLLTCSANILFAVASLRLLPDPTAVHFGADGAADGFASPLEHSLAMIGTVVVLSATLLGVSFLQKKLPTSCFSLPNRAYWLDEKRRPETVKKIAAFLAEMGFGLMAFFLLLQWEVLQANHRIPPRLTTVALAAGTIILFTYLAIITVRLFWEFRLPKDAHDEKTEAVS